MIGNLFAQRCRCSGKALYRLMNNPHVIGVTDVSLKSGGVDPNPTRLDRTSFQQLPDQPLVQPLDPVFAKPLIEFDQGGRVRYRIHQRKPTKIAPRKSLSDFPLYLLITQAPAEFH